MFIIIDPDAFHVNLLFCQPIQSIRLAIVYVTADRQANSHHLLFTSVAQAIMRERVKHFKVPSKALQRWI
jgi:hypothetical protein